MSANTPVLGMVLPGFGEFVDDWWEPLNANFSKIDTAIGLIQTELTDAFSGVGTAAQYLAISLNPDGTLKDIPAILAAENTFLYGFLANGTTLPAFTLKQQLDNLGTELWNAREAAATLKDALAARAFAFPNQLVSGSVNGSGYPNYAGSTGANVRIDGSVTALLLMIQGYMARIRTLKSQTVSGSAGTYFIYATRQPTGVVVVDGATGTNGSTSNDTNSLPTIFADLTVDFTLQDVKVGDYLKLLNSSDAGSYLITAVAPGGNHNKLQIVGNFPVGGQSGVNYTISDRQAVTLSSVVSTGSAPANSIIVAEADFDGLGVTAVRPRNYKNDFVSEWRAVSAAGPVVLAEEIFTHYLGTDKIDVIVQVSQANDGSDPVEELSLSQVSNGTLAVAVTNTLGLALAALGTITPSSGTLSGSASTLASALCTGSAPANFETITGTIAAALTGAVAETRSVAMQWDRNNIKVKGLTSGVFYTDYSGTVRQAGYLRVVARRRG